MLYENWHIGIKCWRDYQFDSADFEGQGSELLNFGLLLGRLAKAAFVTD